MTRLIDSPPPIGVGAAANSLKDESFMKCGTSDEIQCADGGKDCLDTQAAHGFSLIPTPTKIDLRDSHAIRRELGAVYRDMRAGRIEAQEGTRLAYVLDMIRKAYETAVLQDRIELMERTLRHKP